MVRFGVWLSIVALAALQLPWVRCVADCHDVVHLSFEECPDEHAPHDDQDHGDTDHESPSWDVAARSARSVPLVERTLAAAARVQDSCLGATAQAATGATPLPILEPPPERSTVLLL